MSPQGANARIGLLAVLAVGRLLARAVVVSVVLVDVFELRFCCCDCVYVSSVVVSIDIDISVVYL